MKSIAFTDVKHGITLYTVKKTGMQVTVFICCVLLLTLFPNKTSESSSSILMTETTHEITLIFAGDIMQHMPQVEAAWDEKLGIYVYDSCFKYINPWISNAHLAVANLETTLAGRPYSGYPAFSSPDALISGLINAGFDIVGTANNHTCDRGRTGVERTISVLDSLGMMHFGTYLNLESYRKTTPMILNTRGFRIAFLNYTYGTNGIPVPENNIVSLIDKKQMELELTAARDSMVDMTIVFIHWGDEYQRMPNDYQEDIAQFLFEKGADIIIGSHPHVLQPMAWYKADSINSERLVVWSLGNYVSNQRKRYTDGGAMFSLTLKKSAGETSIKDAGYILTWVHTPQQAGKKQYYILPAARFENDTILLDKQAQTDLKVFLNDSRDLLKTNNRGISEIK